MAGPAGWGTSWRGPIPRGAGGPGGRRQAPRMSPLSRSGMAAALATEMSGYVAPSPPPGTTPDDYLAAVLAERRTRELRRLGAARTESNRIGERLHRLPF